MLRIACLPLLALALATPALAQRQALSPAVTVTGEASVRAMPDLAQIRAGVTSTGRTARETSEANAKAMTGVIAALRNSGIAAADLQTARLSLQPVQENTSRGTPGRITSFQAINQVLVRIRDINKVAEVIDSAVGAGANEISGIEFLIADPSKLLDNARAEALADAKRKADIYSRASGAGLGRIISLTEGSSGGEPVMMRAARPMSTPVMPGEQTITIAVTATFQLIP